MKARNPSERSFIVPGPSAGAELIEFIAGHLGCSRRAAKRLLDERRVFVNGRRVWMARHRLSAGDRIEAHGLAGLEEGAGAGGWKGAAVPVLARSADFWIVDKPAGWLSNGPGSIEERLRAEHRIPELRAAHRLDRDTTGCLLIALSAAAFERAVVVFRSGVVVKIYEAIVLGRYPPDRRELDERIDGETARTFVDVLASHDRASHLRLRIETGRTHQIRRHLLGAGHPIAGDKSYGTGRACPEEFRRLPRQMLHARELTLPDPSGGPALHANAPLPGDFCKALEALGLPVSSCDGT